MVGYNRGAMPTVIFPFKYLVYAQHGHEPMSEGRPGCESSVERSPFI
jgi:hypothetical protein